MSISLASVGYTQPSAEESGSQEDQSSAEKDDRKDRNPFARIGQGLRGFGGRLSGVSARNLKSPYIESLAETRDFGTIEEQTRLIAESAGLNLRADGRRDIVVSAATSRYLDGIRDRLLAAWPYSSPKPPIYVIASPFYEMSATHDGSILVNTGMLEAVESEDEIAFLLSHELGHILLGHFVRDEMMQDLLRRSRLTADVLMFTNSVASSSFEKINSSQVLQVIEDPETIRKFNAKSFAILDDMEESIAYGMLPP